MAKKQAVPLKTAAPPKTAPEMPGWLAPLLILLVSFLVYANTLGHDYALDDSIVITDNKYTQEGFDGISDIFSHDSFTGFFGEERNPVEGGRYRPLSIASFAVEHGILGKNNPAVSHLVNVLLFCLTSLLLWKLLDKLFASRPKLTSIPLLATLLFAVHPIHTEAVANIKGRDEIFALLFTLLAFITAIDYVRHKGIWRLGLSFLCFALAVFSKESALPLLLILPLTLLLDKEKRSFVEIAVASFPALLATAFYMIARHLALEGLPKADPNAESELLNDSYKYATGAQHVGTALYCLAYYVKLLFIPWPLTNDYYPYQISLVGVTHPIAILGAVIYVGLVVLAVRGIFKKQAYGWAIAFYLLTISLVSNIGIDIGVFMAERFLFLPSVGFCVAIAWVFHKWLSRKTTVYIAVASPVLLIFAILTMVRNPVWKDNPTLFMTDVDNSPNSAKALTAGAAEKWKAAKVETNMKKREKLLKEAMEHIDKAVKIHPKHAVAWDIRGHILVDYKKDYKAAVKSYETAVSFNHSPNYVRNLSIGWFNLALDAENGTRYPESVEAYRKCIAFDPTNAEAYGKIGMIYGRYLQQNDSAIVYMQRAIETGGKKEWIYNNLGIAYGMKQDFANSVEVLKAGLEVFPGSKELLPSLMVTYRNMGDSVHMKEVMQQLQQ